jgi:hypothetical protein
MNDTASSCRSDRPSGSLRRRRGALARLAPPIAAAALLLGASRSAHAQVAFDAAAVVLVAGGALVEGGIAIGGITAGAGSAVMAAERERAKGWFIASYVFGGLNVAGTILWGSLAAGDHNPTENHIYSGIAAGHAALAAFDIAMPTLGYARAEPVHVAPLVLTGTDVGSRRWTGLGLQISNF